MEKAKWSGTNKRTDRSERADNFSFTKGGHEFNVHERNY